MPKIKITSKSFSFKNIFSLDRHSAIIKPDFKLSKSIIKYFDNLSIFSLPEVPSEIDPDTRKELIQNHNIFSKSNRIIQISSNKNENNKLFIKKTVTLSKSEEKVGKIDENLVTIAKIKKEYFYFLKFLRFVSFYSIAPYNAVLFLHNFHFYSVDWFIFHLFLSNACLFMPYFLTEDWVTNISYDKANNKLHITKINIRCKEYTTIHNPEIMVRIHRKNNLRFFSLFKNKLTNEHYSILHICEIKDVDILKTIIPEKTTNLKREKTHKKEKNNSTSYFKHYLKIVLLIYFTSFFLILFYKIRKIKKENELIIME